MKLKNEDSVKKYEDKDLEDDEWKYQIRLF